MKYSRRQPPAQACVESRYSYAQRLIAAVLLMVVEVAPIRVGVQNVLALGWSGPPMPRRQRTRPRRCASSPASARLRAPRPCRW